MGDEPGTEVSDAVTDGSVVRAVSVLDTTHKGDMFTAYCDRHDCDMPGEHTVVKNDGAIYKLQEPFELFYCPACIRELAVLHNTTPKRVAQVTALQIFDKWDAGESPGDWFKYICESKE